jgi:hypothetical protein
MLIDEQLIFSEEQDASGNGATTVSTNVIDLGPINTPYGYLGPYRRDLGKGVPHDVSVLLNDAAVGGTSARVEWYTDDDEAFGTEILVARSVDIPVASLVKGYQFNIPCDVPEYADRQYHRLKYVTVGDVTVLNVTAAFVKTRPTT